MERPKKINSKFIIDCDPGHDDIMAIITSIANKLNIVGITTVAGNNTVSKVTNNILKVLDYIDVKIPVYKGEAKPLAREAEPQPLAHGESGLDGPKLQEAISKAEDIDAVTFIKRTLIKNYKTSIIALAPLTNIGKVLIDNPELKEKIDCIYLMGGAIGEGNINKHAEFNIYHDPDAAKYVFESGVKIVMAPLEVCYEGRIFLKEYEPLKNGGKVSKLIFDLMEFFSLYARRRNWDYTTIFDLVPVVYILHEEYFEGYKANVDVILEGKDTRGQTIINKNDDGNVLVLTSCKREEFINELFKAINILDKKGEN